MMRIMKGAAVAAVAVVALTPTLTSCSNDLPAAAQAPVAKPSQTVTPYVQPGQVALDKSVAAYRAAFHVMNQRTLPPKATMEKYMTGSYLKFSESLIDEGYTFSGESYLEGITGGGMIGPVNAPTGIKLMSCEDNSKSYVFKDGKAVKPTGSPLYVQHITTQKGPDGVWRVATVSTDQVSRDTFNATDCTSELGGGRST